MKYLSYILRHNPEDIGLKLDNQGWANVDQLIGKMNRNSKHHLDLGILDEIVKTDNKGRFEYNDDKTKIRACQGHSSKKVKIEYPEILPPNILYHGTNANVYSQIITSGGLKKMDRHHVHLSDNYETAVKVGSRGGRPFVFVVKADQMVADGYKFFLSGNGVYLVDSVPVKYLDLNIDNIQCGGVIVKAKNKVLLVETRRNKFGFPKGKREKGETHIHCALRELKEETGLTPDKLTLKVPFTKRKKYFYELSDRGMPSVVFLLATCDECYRVKPEDVEEIRSVGWYDLEKAKELLKGIKNREQLLMQAYFML